MHWSYCYLFLLFCGPLMQAQRTQDAAFDKKVAELLSFTVPTVTVEQVAKWQAVDKKLYFLDARALKEYKVSHIPNARHIGYEEMRQAALNGIPKNAVVIVYCSVGYRSEKIGERLQEAGYQKIYNLYGSLFEWVNQGHPIENAKGLPTQRVHTYSKEWSRWLKRGEGVYE